MRGLLGVSAAAGLCSGACADVYEVYIFDDDFSLNPAGGMIEDPVIQVGDTVRWIWEDEDHGTTTVAGIAEQWDSGMPHDIGFTFDHTFTHTGTFWYYCVMHGFDNGDGTAEGMAGTVTVVPGPGTGVIVAGLAGLGLRRRR